MFEKIGVATLDTKLEVTQSFTFCGSFRQRTITDKGFLSIYGKDEKIWLSLSFWTYGSGEIKMWFFLLGDWHYIAPLEIYTLSIWNHICIEVDTNKREILVILNGLPVILRNTSLGINTPEDLRGKVKIGFTEDENGLRPYEGKVANLILINDKIPSLENIADNLCEYADNNDKDLSWNVTGNVKLISEEDLEICNKNETYVLAIKAQMAFDGALKTCLNKLSGDMPLPNTSHEMNHLLSFFKEEHCKFVWSPLSDEEVEGKFKSVIDGEVATFLPWTPSNPNGGRNHNNVVMQWSYNKAGYNDMGKTDTYYCVYCYMKLSATFLLRGVCKHTYFGK